MLAMVCVVLPRVGRAVRPDVRAVAPRRAAQGTAVDLLGELVCAHDVPLREQLELRLQFLCLLGLFRHVRAAELILALTRKAPTVGASGTAGSVRQRSAACASQRYAS